VPGLRVLFLRGSGVISSACSRLAVERGIELFVLNRGQTTGRPLPPEATVLRGDVRDPASIPFEQGAREIVAWHDEDPARQRIDAGLDALTDKLAQAFRPAS